MKLGESYAAVLLFAAVPCCSQAEASVSNLSASWNRFIGEETVLVCDVLDGLGPVIYNAETSDQTALLIVWLEGSFAIEVNCQPVDITSLTFEGNEATVLGTSGANTFQVTFSVTEHGSLGIEMSNAEGEDAERFTLNPEDGSLVTPEKCVCWGSAASKRKCTIQQCNDVVPCNAGTSGSALCEWRYLPDPL